MADIFHLVRAAIETRLSDPTNGFNAKYVTISPNYQQRDGSVPPALVFDWSSASSNVAWGRVPADLIEESSPFEYPILTIDADRGQQYPYGQRVRYKQFSGVLLGLVEVHLSWDNDEITDFATWPDAVIDATFASLNDPSIPPTWGTGITYAGDLDAVKSPVIAAGDNWRRTISFPMKFTVLV